MPSWVLGLLKPVVGTLGKMAAALLTEVVVKHAVLSMIDYYIASYEKKAAKTEDKLDDLRARKLRQLFQTVSKQWEE